MTLPVLTDTKLRLTDVTNYGNPLTIPMSVSSGGTGLVSGTSGGILGFTGPTTLASSVALLAGLPIIGGGAGATPTFGSKTGNTTVFATVSGGATAGNIVKWDPGATGNIVDGGPAGFLNAVAVTHSNLTLSNGLNSNITTPANSFVRITGPSGAFSVGGFTTVATDGYIIFLYNATAQTMTIVNQDASSSANNKISTLTGANVVLRANATSFATIIYDITGSQWVLMSTN